MAYYNGKKLLGVFGGTKSENKLAQLASKTIKKIEAEDLYGATTINQMFFSDCAELTEATLPDTITELGVSTFLRCTALKNLKLSNNLTVVPMAMVSTCTSLLSLTIPASVTQINMNAFVNSGLTILTLESATPPTLSYADLPNTLTAIRVPSGALATYKAATNWSTYADKIVGY